MPSSGGSGNIDQNFLIQCFEWLTAVKYDIESLRPGAGSWDPQGWLSPAASSLYQPKRNRVSTGELDDEKHPVVP